MELVRLRTTSAPGLGLWLKTLRKGLSGQGYRVEVIDNGPGIAVDIRDNIFDPFVSGKSGGSGLGLALVASVVADHGGMVEVDSVPGHTVFRLNFPLSGKGVADV